MLSEFAPAKLNLALHVRARRADGYHELETLFAFADIGDRIAMRQDQALSLKVTGGFADGLSGEGDNLILRSARLLGEMTGHDPAFAFTLEKSLPVASGIGGGSADAAATLRLLARAWDIAPDSAILRDCAARLGADVPACLSSRTAIGTGRGEALRPVPLGSLAGAPIILANPGVAVPTGPVFAGWDGQDRGALPTGDAAAVMAAGRNDLQVPAIAIAPVIAALIAAMEATAPRTARMSGSGATCFALYADASARNDALAELRRRFPGYWIEPAALV